MCGQLGGVANDKTAGGVQRFDNGKPAHGAAARIGPQKGMK